MKTLSYFVESSAELMIALNLLFADTHAHIDWRFPIEEESYLEVIITCHEKDVVYVEKMLAPFV